MQTKASCYSISPYLKQNKKDQKFQKKKETNVWHGDSHFQSKHSGRRVLSLRGQPGLVSKKCPKQGCWVGRKGGMKEGGGKDEMFVNP